MLYLVTCSQSHLSVGLALLDHSLRPSQCLSPLTSPHWVFFRRILIQIWFYSSSAHIFSKLYSFHRCRRFSFFCALCLHFPQVSILSCCFSLTIKLSISSSNISSQCQRLILFHLIKPIVDHIAAT